MYRAAIIDDDQLARRVLFRILDQHFSDIEIVGEANSVESGVDLIVKEALIWFFWTLRCQMELDLI